MKHKKNERSKGERRDQTLKDSESPKRRKLKDKGGKGVPLNMRMDKRLLTGRKSKIKTSEGRKPTERTRRTGLELGKQEVSLGRTH